MLAALATLAFAATLWLIFVLLAGMVEENGGRIVAAAQARPLAGAAQPRKVQFSPRPRVPVGRPSRHAAA